MMKKILFVLLLVFTASISHAQSKTDMTGMWKILIDVGTKKTTSVYLMLNADGTYIWGIDSSQSDPMNGVSKGTWELTTDKAIKIIPDNSSNRTTYWVKTENKYEYDGYEKDSKKIREVTLGTSMYIQKVDIVK